MRPEADQNDPTLLSSRGRSGPNAGSGLSRRHFLRGLGAAAWRCRRSRRWAHRGCWPEQPRHRTDWPRPARAPRLRSAFIFFPNGAIPSAWWPKEEGADFALSRTLQPLEPIRHRIQVLGGLNHKTAEGGPDGAGDHARGNGTFLTGVRLKKSATDIRAGVSIDQVIAPPGRPPHAVPLARAGLRAAIARPARAIRAIPAPTSTTSPGARPRRRCRRNPTRGWSSSGSSAPATAASGGRT